MSRHGITIVIPARVLPEGLAATITRWPTAHRCAVAARTQLDSPPITVLAPTSGQSDELELDGIRHQAVRCHGRPHVPLARAVAAGRPSVVHVHGLVNGPLVAAVAAVTGGRVRIVTQHHGEPLPSARARRWMRATRRLVDAHLFTGGDAHAALWRQAGLLGTGPVLDVLESSSDLDLHIDPATTAALRSELAVGDAPLVVWVGRATEGKDPTTAITAVELLVDAGLPHHLVMLCSDADSQRSLAEMVAGSPACGHISVRGPIPHQDMAVWLRAADVLLSTSHHEGSGFAVIEAMGLGCPVVAAEIAPLRSILGDCGRWFTPGDAQGAVRALTGRLPRRGEVLAAFEHNASWDRVGRDLAAAWAYPPLAGAGGSR